MNYALKNKLILDFSRLIPGPFCTKILADLGARVIKIEDQNRRDGIGLLGPALGKYLNGQKKNIALDFSSPHDFKKIRTLIKKADVLIESFRPGVMAKLGLSALQVHNINPKLIYVSLTGYGQTGKLAGKAGHDINFMAASGLLVDFLPVLPRFQIADFVGGGLFAALEIMAAMLAGKMRVHLDVAMTKSLKYLGAHRDITGLDSTIGLISGKLARYNLYQSRDKKWLALGALEEKFWQGLCDALGLGKYKTIGFDVKMNKKATAVLKHVFAAKDAAHWRQFSKKYDVCLTVL